MNRVLITGGEGQLARALVAVAPKTLGWWSPKRAVLDITDFDALENKIDSFRPELIINTAAYTAVDRAETHRSEADNVNHRAVANLGRYCSDRGVRILHVSTDYVFDGRSKRPYRVDDEPGPINTYGKSKAAGETALIETSADYNIVRSSWIYAPWGKNFLSSMTGKMARREDLQVVNDQVGAPTSALELAEALWRLAEVWPERAVWHWSNSGQASWFDFAVEIGRQLREAGRIETKPEIETISSEAFQADAPRPHYTVLDCKSSFDLLGEPSTDWRDALSRVVRNMP